MFKPNDELWEEHFEELNEYYKKYGNCNVPFHYQTNKQLGHWVNYQRTHYNKLQKGEHSQITKERIVKLKSINFVWNVGNDGTGLSNDKLWEKRFEELKDYRKKNGNCNVPKNYQHNKQLGAWVNHQRYEYKKCQKGEHAKITKERIAKLKSVGFVWEPPRGRRKRAKTATVSDAQNESHQRQIPVVTKGQGQKRKEIARKSLRLTSNPKRQRRSNPTPDTPPSSSSEIRTVIPDAAPSSRPTTTSLRRPNPTTDSLPSSTEIQMQIPIPDAAPSSSTPSWKPQRRSKYINCRVAKVFYVEATTTTTTSNDEKEMDIFFGTVDKQTNNNPPLWHVQYDDGDEEEFFKDELMNAIKFYKKNRDNDPQVIAHTKKVKAEQNIFS